MHSGIYREVTWCLECASKYPRKEKCGQVEGRGRGDDVRVMLWKPGDRYTGCTVPFPLVCLKFPITIKKKICVLVNDKLIGETDTDLFSFTSWVNF